jgi:hypothetical protein
MYTRFLRVLKKGSKTGFFVLCFVFFACSFQSVQAITLTPTRQTAVIDGGKTQTVKIILQNEEKQTVTVKGVVEGFEIDEKTNRAKFGVRDEATDWVKISPSEVTLAAGETKEILFTFTVPQTAKTKAHYLGLFALVSAEGGQVGISSRVGSLLFLYTSGNFEEKSDVMDFSAGSMWYTKKPVNIFLTLNNTGNIHVQPQGSVSVKNWQGKVVGVYPVNSENHLLLPEKKFHNVFDIPLSFKDIGKVEARLEYRYGVNEQIIVRDISFWYVPLFVLVGTAIAALLILFFIIVLAVKVGTRKK